MGKKNKQRTHCGAEEQVRHTSIPAGLRFGGAFIAVAIGLSIWTLVYLLQSGFLTVLPFSPRLAAMLLAAGLLGAAATTNRSQKPSTAQVVVLVLSVLLVIVSRILPEEPAYPLGLPWLVGFIVLFVVCGAVIRHSFVVRKP